MNLQKKTAGTLGGIAIAVVAGLITLASAAFTVQEEEQVIVLQFGAPVGDPIDEPGLHFKAPFIQEVRRFDKRLQAWDGSPEEVPTKGREFIFVDTTARWRIVDPMRFLESVRDVRGATNRLNDIIDSIVRDEVSNMELVEIVRSTTWDPTQFQRMGDAELFFASQDAELDARITIGREGLRQRILERASRETLTIGAELVDVRLKRVNYVDSVRRRVYDRMISERQRVAAQFRAEGEGRSAEILGRMERELREIRSEAFRIAEAIRGEADASAAAIYAEAYGAAPEFYAFLRTLESYRDTIGRQATLVMDSDADYFAYLSRVGAPVDDLTGFNLQERLQRLEDLTARGLEGVGEYDLDLPDSVEDAIIVPGAGTGVPSD